jgi:hypothetical protein
VGRWSCSPIVAKEPNVAHQQLLAAKPAGTGVWSVETKDGTMKLLPFTSIRDEQYTTYVHCT